MKKVNIVVSKTDKALRFSGFEEKDASFFFAFGFVMCMDNRSAEERIKSYSDMFRDRGYEVTVVEE
jgi:hypothetical protein